MVGCLSRPCYLNAGTKLHTGLKFGSKYAVKSNNLAFKTPSRCFAGKILCTFDDGISRLFGDYEARPAVSDEDFLKVSTLRADSLYGHVENVDTAIALDTQNLQTDCSGDNFYCLIAAKKDKDQIDQIFGALDLDLEIYWQDTCIWPVKSQPELLLSEQPLDCYINNVVASKTTRRAGIASNLVCLAVDVAAWKGMTKAFLHVREANKAAVDCYLKQGFKIAKGASRFGMLLMWKDV